MSEKLATQMSEKLATLKRTTDAIGMTINESKSQVICINSNDTQPFVAGEVSITYTGRTPIYT